ncbi:Transposase_28 domain-containing protein [Cephalotus follicularis]|uniref:Transposase_28 domain-containing protein n=1 Tax=Cephalotus follicularis TaxID=3775 RepID=A0A1Q3D783_CEPFO|nr:Transposase_28 domain-containing protein [Cephalotus follicularis]
MDFPKTSMTHRRMVEKFNVHGGQEVWLPLDGREATVNIAGRFVVFEDALSHGLRLPLPDFASGVLDYYGLHPDQIQPQSWAFIMGFIILCSWKKIIPNIAMFKEFFQVCRGQEWSFHFRTRTIPKLMEEKSIKGWRARYFMLDGLDSFNPWFKCPPSVQRG